MTGTLLARVVFDPDARPERLPLYADGSLEVISRGSARIPPGARASFATYFNAFPAWHWVAHTVVRRVRLGLDLEGTGRLRVLRSSRGGATTIVLESVIEDGRTEIAMDLEPNADGGWLWFELEAGQAGLELRSGAWSTDGPPGDHRRATLSMTTLDKPDFALGVLRRIADDPVAQDVLDSVLVVDQGARHVVEHPDFAPTAASLGARLRVIEQPNLGGSGGFSRGMLEVLDAGRSGSVILIDDDVEIEPESLVRAVSFASFAARPTIVGGQMFDLHRPLRLHAIAERVSSATFDWGPIGPAPLDLASRSLPSEPALHGPVSPDYNGWWFCLIPVEILATVGLSLPVFLKWDDAEFGLRAGAAGFRTVTLPGMAVWHVSWLDKDDLLGWQAFYHARNRAIAGLVDARRGARLLPLINLVLDLRYLVSMDYHVVELRHAAAESVFAGPDTLPAELGSRLAELRTMMQAFPSGIELPIRSQLPPESGKPRPGAVKLAALLAGAVLVHLVARRSAEESEATLAHGDAGWWRVARYRHVHAVNSDGTALRQHVRIPATYRRMLVRSLRDAFRLMFHWGALRRRYRAALPGLVAVDAWRVRLGQGQDASAGRIRP